MGLRKQTTPAVSLPVAQQVYTHKTGLLCSYSCSEKLLFPYECTLFGVREMEGEVNVGKVRSIPLGTRVHFPRAYPSKLSFTRSLLQPCAQLPGLVCIPAVKTLPLQSSAYTSCLQFLLNLRPSQSIRVYSGAALFRQSLQ